MNKRIVTSLITLAALAAPTAAATAADRIVVPESDAQIVHDQGPASTMTALKDNIVWVNGEAPNQTLMQRDAGGTVKRVKGAPRGSYPSIDLGITSRGTLVLTYLRCRSRSQCTAFSDDLDGRRVSFKRLTPRRCALSTAPARWRNRVAYSLDCNKQRGQRKVRDTGRSGLFVRKSGRAAMRLRLPVAARRGFLDWVDLRGTQVGASGGDIAKVAFSQTINRSRLRSTTVAISEGEVVEFVRGVSLGSAGRLWTLALTTRFDPDVHERLIYRQGADGCRVEESPVTVASLDEGDPLDVFERAMAVDGNTIYLYRPGVGIVTHQFDADRSCG